jgi:site-specific DNA-methyltransferase (adenine-specific)
MSAHDLRFGRWQDALADVECDAWISDPPYSERTHAGQADAAGPARDGSARSALAYDPIGEAEIGRIVGSWEPRTRGWFVAFSDHEQAPWWAEALRAAGRYVFSPIPVVDIGSTVRMLGDGPSSWTTWLTVARPRSLSRWGTLPGAYIRSEGDPRSARRGGKPLGVMRAIVRDYSRPGDLVCDPFAGHATTLLAAVTDCRLAVGSECDREAFDAAITRLACGYTPDMFAAFGSAP